MLKYKPKILERINNWFLQVNACMDRKDNSNPNTVINPPKGYSYFVHSDLKNTIDTDFWLPQYHWGQFHHSNGKPIQYCDNSLKYTKATDEGTYLYCKNDPIKIDKKSLNPWFWVDELPETIDIPYSIGLLTSRMAFKYGWFKIEAKLPKGKNLWPSFCLAGTDTWPPEISILDAYSDIDENYSSSTLFKKPFNRIHPSLYYGNKKNNIRWKGYDVYVDKANERFVQYVCWWERDFIKIYYDGVKIFETFDKKILKQFNQPMMVVLNNGIINTQAEERAFIIKNFEVWKNNNY